MKRNWIFAVGLALAIGVLGFASVAAAEEAPSASEEAAPASEEVPPASEAGLVTPLDETCEAGNVCSWTETHFHGVKNNSLCTGGSHPFLGFKESVKNRCPNKAVWVRINGTQHGCVEHESQNALPVPFNEIWVGAEGSHC